MSKRMRGVGWGVAQVAILVGGVFHDIVEEPLLGENGRGLKTAVGFKELYRPKVDVIGHDAFKE